MHEEFNNFLNIDDVQKSIAKISKNGFPKFDHNDSVENYIEKISKVLTEEFKILPNLFLLTKRNHFPFNFYRVRELNSFTNINLFSEHSCPPINSVGFGRCNFPKYPVFYCSNDPGTALLEVVRNNLDKGKEYCISRWEISDSDQEFAFQSFLQTDLAEENNFNALKDIIRSKINEPFEKKLTEKQEMGLLEYLKFLDSSFINDKDYTLSACLAHRALYAKHSLPTDILMYPSVQTNFKGVNMAVHPNFINNHVRVSRFYIIKFDNYNSGQGLIQISLTKYGEVEKNVIIWKNILPDDKLYEKYISEDFGHLIDTKFIIQT